LAFFYLVKESPDVKYTQVAWYQVDGTRLWVEKRSGKVLSGALLPGGHMVEGNAEEVFVRKLQTTPTTSGNN